ncbi:MAG: Fructose/tagatose bisphosphate aldolase [Thermodesulfobacterium sp.]|uniref:Fructose/tagatose bisphosphate aldolase n=1 Tax=Candidatus Thermodesulfobacterium syntrophicum TaxID=3060442 RepID=A0AAE3TEF2_9BACT|nr:Fructose/tagatose bisphosphate aldolase [Candidatus Thermodesulfobacterium syntrophicum]
MKKKEILNLLKEKPKEIDNLIYKAVFGDLQLLKTLQEVLKEFDYRGFSIYPLYKEFSKKFLGFTVPAINIRGMTYDVARTIFRVAKRLKVGALIFEIAKSEMGYTKQSPLEYATVVLSAGFREKFEGPIFIQGDHFQFNRKSYFSNAEREKNNIKNLIKDAVSAQFYNVDIDASTLVILEEEDLDRQQKHNYEVTAEMAEFVRFIEPEGITVNLGGEIGEIGGHNSTPEELRVFMKGFNRVFKREVGISKISVQTGTSHGGVVLPDGKVATINLDFNTLKTLSKIAREEFGLAGAVQHGASTLPEDYFNLFPECECVEVHLATGFQNFIYDHPALPQEFREKIYSYLKTNLKNEWKEDMTEAQFIYKTRKKGFGIFKKDWWDLSSEIKEKILSDMEGLFEKIFRALNVVNTSDLVKSKVLSS